MTTAFKSVLLITRSRVQTIEGTVSHFSAY